MSEVYTTLDIDSAALRFFTGAHILKNQPNDVNSILNSITSARMDQGFCLGKYDEDGNKEYKNDGNSSSQNFYNAVDNTLTTSHMIWKFDKKNPHAVYVTGRPKTLESSGSSSSNQSSRPSGSGQGSGSSSSGQKKSGFFKKIFK